MLDSMLQAGFVRRLVIGLLIVLVMLTPGCARSIKDSAREPVSIESLHEKGRPESSRPTALELQARLMSYADRYLAKVSQATTNYEKKVKTREAKNFAQSTFIFPDLAVIGIAAGNDPASDLIDMVVFASLQREVLEAGWAREILGSHSVELIAVQKNLEEQIWRLAREILSPIQQTELRQLIEAWRKANPQQRFVTSVRFDDVAILRGRNEISHALSDSIGLLAPIDQAVREAQGIRLLAERGAYIMQHIPPLLLAQARYVVHEQVSPEQMDGLVRDFSALSGSVADAQKAFAGLPQFITKEREALLHEWDKRQDSLAALLASTAPVFEAGKGMSADLRETVAMLEKLLQSYEKSGTVINDTIERSQALVRYMDSTPPFDPTKLLATLDALIRLGQEIDHLAARLQTTAGQNLELAVFSSYERLLNAFFWRLLLLVAAILALILIYRYLSQRYLGGSRPGQNQS